MKSDKLQAIAEKSAANLIELIMSRETEILSTIHEMTEEAQDNGDDKLSFAIGHKITLDLVKGSQNDAISFALTRKSAMACPIPDPEQPDLPELANFAASMAKSVGPGGSVEIINPTTGKGTKIHGDGKITRIDGKETATSEQ